MLPSPGRDVASRIGRLGLLDGSLRAGAEVHGAGWTEAMEAAGVGCFWVPAADPGFHAVRSLLDATTTSAVGTAVLSVWDAPASLLAGRFRELAARAGDRFVLGLGISHAPLVEVSGRVYDRPLARLRDYLDELDGYAPGAASTAVLGVNGPLMLALARDHTAGAVPYLVTPDHTASARAVLGAEPLLAPEQKVLLETDPATARAVARERLAIYLTLPNYLANLVRLGFDGADLAGGGSDRLVDALVAWGSAERVAARVSEHWAAGADHVAVHLLGPRGADPAPAWLAISGALELL